VPSVAQFCIAFVSVNSVAYLVHKQSSLAFS
jgi:hypothetical protein